MTIQNVYLSGSYLWPATWSVGSFGGMNYEGERIRLKSSFDISGYSSIAHILLTQLKQYGVIIADGGTGWSIDLEYTKWPTAIQNAFIEISSANPIGPSNFEVVDESGFELSSTSGECTCNRETITFTRTSDSATASTDVILTGVMVNFPYDRMQIQVGAPALQLTALVNGASNNAVTWSMTGSTGTLSSSGLYTPPESVASPTTITVKATSSANSSVAASMTLVVFPVGSIRLIPGSVYGTYEYEMVPTSYTDSNSNVWYSIGDDGGASAQTNSVAGTDATVYNYTYGAYASPNDMRFDFIVPNGNYNITYKCAVPSSWGAGLLQDIEVNGSIVYTNLDVYTAAGRGNLPFNFTTSVAVSNNTLSTVLRMVGTTGPYLTALEIDPTGLTANVTVNREETRQ